MSIYIYKNLKPISPANSNWTISLDMSIAETLSYYNRNDYGNNNESLIPPNLKLNGQATPFGKSITAFQPVPGCPQGLEGLTGEKTFYFQEVQRGHIEYELKDETRPSYNILTDDGERLYVMMNQAPAFASKRYFHYDLVGPNGMTCMTFEGKMGKAPFLACCKPKMGKIQAILFHQVVGEIVPVYPHSLCHLFFHPSKIQTRFKFKYVPGLKTFDAKTATGKHVDKELPSGLRSIHRCCLGSRLASIHDCRHETFDFTQGKVNFALELQSKQAGLDPVGKGVLLAYALLHDLHYVRAAAAAAQRRRVAKRLKYQF